MTGAAYSMWCFLAVFQEGQLGTDENVNVIMKYVLMMTANFLWRYIKYHQALTACFNNEIVQDQL